MTPIRWLLIFFTGLFILLATAAVQAFRLRDPPPKALASENLLKKIIPQTKVCDSCDIPVVDISPTLGKVKTPVIQTYDDKTKLNIAVKKTDAAPPKKGFQQIRPGFRIRVFKKDDSDDDDDNDEEDDDDSDIDTEVVVDSDESEEEFSFFGNSKEINSDNDEDESEDEDDSEDGDESEDNERTKNENVTDDDDSDEEDDDDDDDHDDEIDIESDDNDDDENTEEDSEDEETGSDTDSDGTVLVIKSNLESSLKTVKNILKETSKTTKPTLQEDKPPVVKTDIPHKKAEPQRNVPTKDSVKLEAQKDNKQLDSKKDNMKPVSPKQETSRVDPKKNEQNEVLKSDHKKEDKRIVSKKEESKSDFKSEQTLKPEIKKQPVNSEPKKETIKTEIKKESTKIDSKKEEVKIDPKKEQMKRPEEVKKHNEPIKITATDPHSTSQKNKVESHDKKNEDKKQIPVETKVKVERETFEEHHQSSVHKAINRKNLRESDFEDFYTFFPTFAPNFSRIHNPECRRQGQILMRQLKGAKIWPLQMLDSTAKLPSGILKGSGNQLGDYDQCVSTNAKVRLSSGSVVKVSGKYCLAQVDLKPTSEEAKLPVHLTQARNFIRSVNTDPGHFIPRFTSLNWGVCLPAACDAAEAEFVLKDALRHYNGTIGIRIIINVDPINCYTDETISWSDWFDIPTIGTLLFYALIISVTAYATIVDIILLNKSEENKDESNDEDKEQTESEDSPQSENCEENGEKQDKAADTDSQNSFVKCFSLKESTTKLLKDASAEGDIECIHGIRALCSLALYVAHKLIPLAMIPFTNRVVLTELSNSPFSVALRASLLYTDSFLLLSGILTAYHMSQDLDRTGSIPWMKRYIARYLRLTPSLLAVLLWYAWISDKIGDGPLWGSVVTRNAELCQSNMWQNIFYIQNFFPFEEMCATHTHQLALDMQLWWLAPVSVWMLRSKPTWALGALGGLHSLTVWLRYSTTQSEYLSLVIYHGISLNQLYRTANLCYSLALHRATPYLAGISLGVLLQQTGKEMSFSKLLYIPGWLASFYFGIWALYTPAHLSMRDYKYDVNEAAQYAALASVAWSLSLSWIIFTCFTGNAGPLNRILCSKPLVFMSRISYAMYLCQFLIFFYNVGSTRTSSEFGLLSAINIVEFTVVLIVSTMITLLLDIPMQNAKKCIMSIEIIFGKKEDGDENTPKEEENKEFEENANENQEDFVQEEQVESDEVMTEEGYEYDEEQLENEHYNIEHDVIYEEEEEYDPDMEQLEQEEYDNEQMATEELNNRRFNRDDNQGEEDEELQEWEWTNGELCFNSRS